MINAKLDHVKNLEEFNSEIRRQQEEAHGPDYCQIHDAIRKYIVGCDSYMELGTHQGGTASVAMLCNPSSVTLVDIDMSRYRKYLSPIAAEYCLTNDIELNVLEADSTSLATSHLTDMLVIDSYHNTQHMEKELTIHGFNTSKYIVAHDTNIINGRHDESLFRCLEAYAHDNNWSVVERGMTNVGYTVIRRNF